MDPHIFAEQICKGSRILSTGLCNPTHPLGYNLIFFAEEKICTFLSYLSLFYSFVNTRLTFLQIFHGGFYSNIYYYPSSYKIEPGTVNDHVRSLVSFDLKEIFW